MLDIRERLFLHFQRLSTSFHERYTSGRVISRQTSDVEAIADLLGHGLVNLITSALLIGGIGIALLLLDLPLALVSLASFPVLFVMTRWFRSRAELAYRATREAVALVIVHFVESLGGIHAVHAFRREPRNQEIFEHLDDRYRRANNWSRPPGRHLRPGVQLVGRLTIAVVLLVGALPGARRRHDRRRARRLPPLPAPVLRADGGAEPVLQPVPGRGRRHREALGRARRGAERARARRARPRSPTRTGEIRFDGVEFGYRERTVLHHLDLDDPRRPDARASSAPPAPARRRSPGSPRASGTRPTARVLLDGIDLRDLTEADLRRAVITVTQESFLFAGSVADNIRARPPRRQPRRDRGRGRAPSAPHEFIAALPDGYDTDVHQKGARLSSGQRQLVSFARAFLADPAVLILDEATSSLDVPSERLVQHALRTLLADRTAVIIAHRLTTVEIADRVIVVDAGRIVEDGAAARPDRRRRPLRRPPPAWIESLV